MVGCCVSTQKQTDSSKKNKKINKNLNDTIVVQLADENITDHALHDSIRDMA